MQGRAKLPLMRRLWQEFLLSCKLVRLSPQIQGCAVSSQGAQRGGGCALHDGARIGQGRVAGPRRREAKRTRASQGSKRTRARRTCGRTCLSGGMHERTRARGGVSERTQLPASSRTNPSDAESRTNPSAAAVRRTRLPTECPRTNPSVSSSKRTHAAREPNEPERGGPGGRTCSLAACTNGPSARRYPNEARWQHARTNPSARHQSLTCSGTSGRVPGRGVEAGQPGSPWRVGPLGLMRPQQAA
jgi:hypothetical protein